MEHGATLLAVLAWVSAAALVGALLLWWPARRIEASRRILHVWAGGNGYEVLSAVWSPGRLLGVEDVDLTYEVTLMKPDGRTAHARVRCGSLFGRMHEPGEVEVQWHEEAARHAGQGVTASGGDE